ncbi:hypothetical protein QBC42DRAFT_329252 [Cladorrhinum samala]|uniref:Rad50/SbcC-type AAA domain-containing protein n=1 Tax=Cladorrhinum samala TaxID=585594 RepID=A0AAV9HZP3_9PEZI|nr:hypothetical protein QBC42DRAFT_329252 [Cladorrhinum samala]
MPARSARTGRWLLLSDLHFKHNDLDRVQQTAEWIVAEAERNKVKRAVLCGDLLTSRTTQSTHVLSACYRFISSLSDVVPHVHIVLGNHDLAYRRDYQTSALDALSMKRLAPYVSVHSTIAQHKWDGRRVLLLPFREDQNELTEAVAALAAKEASKTVAFAHLAINKAITQRYVVNAGDDKPRTAHPITYPGFTGPDKFASLARTFTGHFHSHQTIVQKQISSKKDRLHGSITYLGSPLQLTWADLYDEQRGVVLFNPKTLEHELLVNPHAVGYTAVELQQVLDGTIDEAEVADKHVMILGRLTNQKYVAARDKLLSLRVRSVRDWAPMGFALHANHRPSGHLGASAPASDAAIQPLEEPTGNGGDVAPMVDGDPGSGLGIEGQVERLDLASEARGYVESIDLDDSLLSRKEDLVRVGQRIIETSREIMSQDGEVKIKHLDFLNKTSEGVGITNAIDPVRLSPTHVFVAEPRRLTISNFLGVQNTIVIDFQQDLPRGLTFLVGDNGSGKSTLVEAITWCQFGQCIRDGLGAKDVVNDSVRKNCSVRLEFANGYTIERSRNQKPNGNRVVVSLHGEPQLQFEHPNSRTTQAAIDELLGIDYETYVRTVVLSHGGAASFLSSTPAERRDHIEGLLGLSILDQCAQVSRLLLKDIDSDISEIKVRVEGLARLIEYSEQKVKDLRCTERRLEAEEKAAVASLEAAVQEQQILVVSKQSKSPEEPVPEKVPEQLIEQIPKGIPDKSPEQISEQTPEQHLEESTEHILEESPEDSARHRIDYRVEVSALQNQIHTEQENLQRLENSYAEKMKQKQAESRKTWLGRLQQRLGKMLEAMSASHPPGLQRIPHRLEIFLLATLSSLSRLVGGLRDGFKATSTPNDKKLEEEGAVNALRKNIEKSKWQLQCLKHREKLTVDHALKMNEQLARDIQTQKERVAQAIRAQKERQAKAIRARKEREARAIRAQKEREARAIRAQKQQDAQAVRARKEWEAQFMRAQKAREALQRQVTIKQTDLSTYKHLIETETRSLDSRRSEHDTLAAKLEGLASDRELFAFWSSALTKRTRSSSSSSSYSSSSSASSGSTSSTANFREHILEKFIPELNTLLAQILAVLYSGSRRGRDAHPATGMMSLLFDHDSAITPAAAAVAVLDRNLSVHPSLAYGKRSGGERKRVDLALFFALLQLARARSWHRAHYLFVDEVFDSLDEAGQKAVVRWCEVMSRTLVGWTVIITHSRYLIDHGEGGEEGARTTVLRARMGRDGTQIFGEGGRRTGSGAEKEGRDQCIS